MDSRERDPQPRPASHSLSSLIVRPSDSGGGGSDYEPGEVRQENPSHENPHHFRSRSGRFPEKNQGYEMHAGSVLPLRQRKVGHHYGMRAGSVSPLHQRNLDKHHGIRAGSVSPLRRGNVDNNYGIHVGSVSPLCRRTVDKHYVIHANSISPLRQRNADNHFELQAGSISPLRQRNFDNHYGMRSRSISPLHQRKAEHHFNSPLRQRKAEHHFNSGFDHPGGPRRGRGFIRGGRGPGRFRDISPPFGRGRGGRSFERGFDAPGFGPSQFRGDGIRNDPNVSPREGDWICSDPSCGNLNFARREFCNNCNRLRFGPGGGGPGGSPRGRYLGPPSPCGPWPRNPEPPMDRGPARNINGFDSPPRDWGRDGPRAFGMGPPPPRRGGRFPDHHIRRQRPNYREDNDFRERDKLDRSMPAEWGYRDNGNGDFFQDSRGYNGRDERRPPPLLLPNRDQWARDERDRSRSPMRGGAKDYRRGSYMGRGRGGRLPIVRTGY